MPRVAGIGREEAVATETANLFVYGTLADPARLRCVLGRTRPAIPAVLNDYRRREGKYPYLMRASGRAVRGWILRKIGTAELERLDRYEVTTAQWHDGAMRRLYSRELADVVTMDGVSIRCWVYMPNLVDWPASWR
jgi:gamma-glutamylcyclotransferase (GGCT)/AIG2-like uncharacterized protein YtfP